MSVNTTVNKLKLFCTRTLPYHDVHSYYTSLPEWSIKVITLSMDTEVIRKSLSLLNSKPWNCVPSGECRRGHTPNLWPWTSGCESCCRRDSVFWLQQSSSSSSLRDMINVVQWLNMSRIHHQERWYSVPSYAGTSASLTTVNLECQTGQAYWRSGPGRITVQKQTLRRAGVCTKTRISRTTKLNKKAQLTQR